jgi:ATP-dependent DNA helicase RecG
MEIVARGMTADQFRALLDIEESHFVDLKSADISPSSLTKTVAAFCNTSGGEIFLGIEEIEGVDGQERLWKGLNDQEAYNAFLQVIEAMSPLGNHYAGEFLTSDDGKGTVLHLTVFKTQEIIKASNGKVHVRRGSQNLPVEGEDAIERLRYDKGMKTFEDEVSGVPIADISNSLVILDFLMSAVPAAEPEEWLKKQRVVVDGRATVAGVLLYSDDPQAILPKRSAVKILQYKTKEGGERDYLAFDPLTMEGSIYSLIYDSVAKCKEIIEGIKKLGPDGLEQVAYPEEALHEVLTNAVLHRDYSIAADVQVRIFDNRVEIESPGKLPGHVTVKNITKTQFARNPKLVRLVNKFKEPPNKDVGEGLRTTFEVMDKLRLKPPIINETENSIVVVLRHESLGSPEQLVMQYLEKNPEITNSIARDLTGIKSENVMKQVFYRLRDANQIEQVPGKPANKAAWRRKV